MVKIFKTKEGTKQSLGLKLGSDKKNYNPGPGTYKASLYDLQKKPKYSIAKRYKSKALNKNPGPGTYKHKSTVNDDFVKVK